MINTRRNSRVIHEPTSKYPYKHTVYIPDEFKASNRKEPPTNQHNQNVDKIVDKIVDKPDPKILWSIDTVTALRIIVRTINTGKLMRNISHMIKYYMNKHKPLRKDYRMLTRDNTFENNQDVILLAYICEIRLQSHTAFVSAITPNLIYKTVCKILKEVIDDVFRYNDWGFNYDELYMINEITQILSHMCPYPDNPHNTQIVSMSYFITKQIMQYDNNRNNLLNIMDTLSLRTQDLDMSFLTPKQIQNYKSIFKTKRTLYFRIFLVISNYMLHEGTPLNNGWVGLKTEVETPEEFVNFLRDMMTEILVSITGFNLIQLELMPKK